jgi:hypothetical protein
MRGMHKWFPAFQGQNNMPTMPLFPNIEGKEFNMIERGQIGLQT